MPYRNCLFCSKEFYVKVGHIERGWGKYCSHVCQGKDRVKGKFIDCYICGKQTWKMPSDISKSKSGYLFCSKACSMSWKNKDRLSGENHPLWNGGETVYKRYMQESGRPLECEVCKILDTRLLVVHHIDRNRKNNQLSNLQWLCRNCHYLEHNGKTV